MVPARPDTHHSTSKARLIITCNSANYLAIGLTGTDNLSDDARYTVTVDTFDIEPLNQGLGQPVTLEFIAEDGFSHTVCHTLLAIEDKGIMTANPEQAAQQAALLTNAKRRYELTVGSRLSLLDNTQHSRVFVDTSLDEIITHILAGAGYHHGQIQFSLATPLPQVSQCVQAMENNRAFFNRLLSQYGLFYFFDTRDNQSTIVITDTNQTSPYLGRGLVQVHAGEGFNRQITDIYAPAGESAFVGFSGCQVDHQMATGLASIMSHDMVTDASDNQAEHLAENNFAQPVASNHGLASHFAQQQSLALNSLNQVITLVGNVPDMFAGCSFSLSDNSGLNTSGDYLCISVEHHCQQPSDESTQDGLSQYVCVVKAIPRATPFKLPLAEPAPLPMVFSAKVEALGGVPTLTEQGDYYTKFDVDKTAQAPLGSTQPLRKLVNYACANQPHATGWHFPLTQDAQVLLGCFNNDPTQAYLMGFASNDEQPSIVNSFNHTHNRMLSRAGHELRFDDDGNVPTVILQTLGGEHYLELNAKAGNNYIEWASRLGSLSLVAGDDILFTSDEQSINLNAKANQQFDIKGVANLTAEKQNVAMQSALAHQQTANNITFEAEQDATLLTGRSVNVRADSEIALQTEQGSLTVNVPEGSTIINAEGDIRIEGTGSGDITLYNQGGMIKLDSGGNVELIGSDVLTLNGQMITFDGDVTYEITSPKTASEPSANAAPSIARIADINNDAATEQDIAPQTIDLAYHYQDGEPVKNAPYTLKLADGTEIKGALDDSGQATLDNMPTGQFSVQYGEDSRDYAPEDTTTPNPLYGKITPANAVAMVESGDTSLLDEAGSLAASAGDWLWGTLQGDFNENPSTSQVVVGSIISMIPVIDQIMDCRDVCANVMVLTDDDKANDTNGWIALTLTGIGFIPVIGSAVKGVGKVIVKNADSAMSVAAATLRKLGKGDPIAYIKNIDWQDLGKQAAALIKEKVQALREALTAITASYKLKWLLPDDMLANLKQVNESLATIIPTIEQGIASATNLIETKAKQAIKAYEGELPHRGRTGEVKKVKTDEVKAPLDNDLKGVVKPKSENFIDPSSLSKIGDISRKPKLTNDGKVIPFGGQPSDAITIRNKKNLDENGYLHRKGKKLKYDSDGFPIFDSKFDTHIDDIHVNSGKPLDHFRQANQNLAKQLKNNPNLAKKLGLTDEQVAHILKVPPSSDPAKGLTWHHHQDVGRMQLIDRATHDTFRHTGGMSIWGGGY
ncbi:hypothetical protein DXX93_08205 [Thalassotalea euphylliae]|uniref:Type VI secretion system tip protein VgrG n=1 Tax=Thalassotalea euphylliae TaxID=1655234 RepID=A0A3E0TPW2_9GAMM|nr:contractile injection system protein, VgrG/Pvc8 family [Thalassotalea euphylliae]REL26564.1 hypothetical protein DXX93_08205 [Thalassotalea euphylliae]